MSYISKIRIAAVVLAAGAVRGGFVASSAHADGGGNMPAAKAQPTPRRSPPPPAVQAPARSPVVAWRYPRIPWSQETDAG